MDTLDVAARIGRIREQFAAEQRATFVDEQETRAMVSGPSFQNFTNFDNFQTNFQNFDNFSDSFKNYFGR